MAEVSEDISVQRAARTTWRTTLCTDPFFTGKCSGGGGSRSRVPTSTSSKTAEISPLCDHRGVRGLSCFPRTVSGSRLYGQVVYARPRVVPMAESGNRLRSEASCMAGNLVRIER